MFHSKYEEKELKKEFGIAKEILASEKLEFIDINKNYILFKIKGADFSIVAYPHKTSAGNRHIRVRDENSKNKVEAKRIMNTLFEKSGNNCRFWHKRN